MYFVVFVLVMLCNQVCSLEQASKKLSNVKSGHRDSTSAAWPCAWSTPFMQVWFFVVTVVSFTWLCGSRDTPGCVCGMFQDEVGI